MQAMYLLILLICPLFVFSYLNVTPNSVIGTENLELALTDKQLAIQKYLAWLTLLQNENTNKTENSTKFGWNGWDSNYNNDQRYLPAVRYPLSFIGYATAALVYKTPAYRELGVRMLDNIIQRLLEDHQYRYIEIYWSDLKSFPDPVYYENIMYSGHLAMLISLYESLSGDFKYTNEGWSFTWNGKNKIEYNSKKLMDAIYKQVHSDETGGVACEPNSIFVICNNHHRIAYSLYDAIHKTNYSNSNRKWEHWLIEHGRAPDILPDGDYRFFRIIYYQPIHAWIPLYGTSGNDAWALTFMNSWINDKAFAADGYKQILKSKQWTKVSADQEYLNAGVFGKLSELNTWLASSLFLSVENQYATVKTNKSLHVLNWFEKNFGAFEETVNCNNSYIYKINDTEYQIWTIANLLLSMVTDNNTFYEMYNRPFYLEHQDQPELTNIDYPNLHVSYAFYNGTTNQLKFGLKTDCYDVINTSFIIRNCQSYKQAFMINGDVVIDITKYGHLDSNDQTIRFSGINMTYATAINSFDVYF